MKSLPRMDGRVCLVTGATRGLGRATALGLAKLGADVHVVTRSLEVAEHTAKTLSLEAGHEVGRFVADLARPAEVVALAAEVKARLPKLHILVNNAAVLSHELTLTPEGFEQSFAVNHLAPFRLTTALLPLLGESGPGRIINLTCGIYERARVYFDDLQSLRWFNGVNAYARTRLYTHLFTRELALRLERTHPGLTANTVDPGAVRSGLGLAPDKVTRLVQLAALALRRPPEKAALAVLHAAAAPSLATVSGVHLVGTSKRRPIKPARDPETARRLWEESAHLLGMAP